MALRTVRCQALLARSAWAEQAAVPARAKGLAESASCPLAASMGMNSEGRHPF